MTIGTYGEPGADDKHFNRPTFMDWFPDGSFVVADGYNGTRVVKFDKDGKYLTAWGQRGEAGKETRPGYFNNVHGIAVDPKTRQRVRQRPRQPPRAGVRRERQVPPTSGRSARRRPTSTCSTSSATATCGRPIAAPTNAEVRPRTEISCTRGARGATSPAACGACTASASDQDGNVYVAEVDNGGAQKYQPAQGRQSRDDDRQAASRRVEIEHY